MPKNSDFLSKAHSAQWDAFVWTCEIYINGLRTLFALEICCDSCHFKLPTPTQLWLLGLRLDWNLSGVIELVCHLLLIIGKFLDPAQEVKIPFAQPYVLEVLATAIFRSFVEQEFEKKHMPPACVLPYYS